MMTPPKGTKKYLYFQNDDTVFADTFWQPNSHWYSSSSTHTLMTADQRLQHRRQKYSKAEATVVVARADRVRWLPDRVPGQDMVSIFIQTRIDNSIEITNTTIKIDQGLKVRDKFTVMQSEARIKWKIVPNDTDVDASIQSISGQTVSERKHTICRKNDVLLRIPCVICGSMGSTSTSISSGLRSAHCQKTETCSLTQTR